MALSVTWITSWLCFVLLCSRLFRPQFYCVAQHDGLLSQLQWTDIDNHKRLRVSLRNSQLQEAEAAQVSFAQLELHNIHPTESIIIYSVSTTVEETSWADPKTGKIRYWLSTSEETSNDDEDVRTVMSKDNDEYRRQMHVSHIPGNFLQLGPDQVAVLALSFFPRFPANHEVHNVEQAPPFYTDDSPTHQSKYEYVDWNDWVHSTSSRRNNVMLDHFPRKASYQVKTTLVIETNTETLRIPISGTSVMQNKYGIPSMIMLDSSVHEEALGEAFEEEKVFGQSKDAFVVSRVHPQRGRMSYSKQDNFMKKSDCFDVYIRHPYHSRKWNNHKYNDEPDSDPPVESLEVKEVSVTRPDLVGLLWIHGSGGSDDKGARPRRSIHRWGDGGPLTVPPDDAPHYFVTVCALSTEGLNNDAFESGDELIDSFSNQPQSMGFLQIRTSHDNLLVALEQKRKIDGEESLFQEEIEREDLERFNSPMNSQRNESNVASPTLMRSVPASLQHVFVLTREGYLDGANRTFTFGLRNEADTSIRILRASIVAASRFDGIAVRMGEFNSTLSGLISGRTFVSDAFSLECSVDWDMMLGMSSSADFSLEGSILIRAAVVAKAKKDTVYDADTCRNSILLEIPYSIRIVAGNVVLAAEEKSAGFLKLGHLISNQLHTVKGAFFPVACHSFAAADKATVAEDVFVLSDMGDLVRLEDVGVLDTWKNPLRGSHRTISHCSRLEARLANAIPFNEETVLGQITLSYRPIDRSEWDRDWQERDYLPTWCYLSVTTTPSTGQHIIPIAIYQGTVDFTASPILLDTASESESSGERQGGLDRHWSHTIVGVDNILDWLNTAQIGSALLATITDPKVRQVSKWDEKLVRGYFYKLNEKIDMNNSRLVPILLNVGAISQGDVESVPLYLTNHNPVPITVSIDVSEVEGFSVILGQDQSTGSGDGNNPLDYLPPKLSRAENIISSKKHSKGTLRGHPVDGLREFLLRDVTVNNYLSQFSFRDAVSLSNGALSRSTYLHGLFGESAQETFHCKRVYSHRKHIGCGTGYFPETYGPFSRSASSGNAFFGPIVLSEDGRKVRRTKVCRGAADSSVRIPPGGYARFDISIRSPPAEVLEQDITRFLSSGLMLSTDHGQIIPILASFQALQGKLHVSHIPAPSLGSTSPEGVIQVPMGVFGKPGWETKQFNPIYIPPSIKDEGLSVAQVAVLSRNVSDVDSVSLFMRSSFSRHIKLRRIVSCNPWFRVELSGTQEQDGPILDPILGVNVGVVSSNILCNGASDLTHETVFPSFFRCAISWLIQRAELQPRGCGPLPPVDGRHNFTSDVTVSTALDKVIRTLKRSIVTFEQSDRDTSRGYGDLQSDDSSFSRCAPKNRVIDGKVSFDVLRAAADTSEAWKTISDLGLETIATSLRAVIEYNATSGDKAIENKEENPVLAVVIRNVTVQTTLEVPRLVDGALARNKLPFFARGRDSHPSTLSFPATLVGAVNSIHIPLRNPTAVPVRVRLAIAPFTKDSVSKLQEEFSADAALTNFAGKWRPPYIQSSSDMAHTADQVNACWWGPDRAYFQVDTNGDITRSYQNVTIKAGSGAKFTLIDPSVMFNIAFLAGCGKRCGLPNDGTVQKRTPFVHGLVGLNPMSPIGASAAAGHFLLGRGSTLSKKNKNRLAEGFESGGSMMLNGGGPSAFAIPIKGLKEIVIPPFGRAELGPILFRPPGRTTMLGCASNSGSASNDKCGQSNFESLILLENSLTGIERILLTGKSMWTKLAFLDPEPMPDEDDFGDIVLRNGKSSLMFSGTASMNKGYPCPVVKQLILRNLGDSTVNVTEISIFHDELFSSQTNLCSAGDFDLLTSFPKDTPHVILLPGSNFSLSIQHRPTCNKRKDAVTLSVEYSHINTEMKDNEYMATKLPFHSYSVNLTVGYDMLDWEFRSCKPSYSSWSHEKSSTKTCSPTSAMKEMTQNHSSVWILSFLLMKWSAIIFALKYMVGRSVDRRTQSIVYNCFLKRGQKGETALDLAPTHEMGTDWFAAFRCLARVEPSPVDLQTLGREQTRQIVLHRYRMMKIPPPQYFTGTGIFIRESHGTSKQPGTMRTLSDGLFGNFVPSKSRDYARLPCQLGWRPATARGIINDTSLNSALLKLETNYLSERRSANLAFTDDSRGEQSSDASESSGASITLSDGAENNEAGHRSAISPARSLSPAGVDSLSGITSKDKMFNTLKGELDDSTNLEKGGTEAKPDRRSPKSGFQQVKLFDKPQRLHEKTPREAIEKISIERTKKLTIETSRGSTEDAKPIAIADPKHGKTSKHKKPIESRRKTAPLDNTEESGPEKLTNKAVSTGTKKVKPKKGLPQNNPWKSSTLNDIDSHDREVSHNVRPPPGLAPPPGFSSRLPSEKAATTSTGSHSHPLLGALTKAPVSQYIKHPELPKSTLFTSDEEHPPPQEAPSDPSDEQFLAQSYAHRATESFYVQDSAEFDVMAFLDDILNEGSTTNNGATDARGTRQEGIIQEEPAFSPNPWATSDIYQSRAAAYGILIEDESNRGLDSGDLPVLTPETILSATVGPDDHENASKTADFFSDFVDQG